MDNFTESKYALVDEAGGDTIAWASEGSFYGHQ